MPSVLPPSPAPIRFPQMILLFWKASIAWVRYPALKFFCSESALAEYTDRVDPSHRSDPDQHLGQDSSVVPSETGSEAQEPEPHYLASINQIYELIFNTLDDSFCPRPAQSIINTLIGYQEGQ